MSRWQVTPAFPTNYHTTVYLLNKFSQHLLTHVLPNHKWKKSAVEMLHGFHPQYLYFPPPLCFFCSWSDFIPYATELFGPVGRWCSPHLTVHKRHRVCCRKQTTCTSSLWPALTIMSALIGPPFTPTHYANARLTLHLPEPGCCRGGGSWLLWKIKPSLRSDLKH